MDITQSRDLYVGLFDDRGDELAHPSYARQNIALRWADDDEEIYKNVGRTTFGTYSKAASTTFMKAGIWVGDHVGAPLLCRVPLSVTQTVSAGCAYSFEHNSIRIPRADLLALHGPTFEVMCYRTVELTERQKQAGLSPVSLYNIISLEFKPRESRQERTGHLFGIDAPVGFPTWYASKPLTFDTVRGVWSKTEELEAFSRGRPFVDKPTLDPKPIIAPTPTRGPIILPEKKKVIVQVPRFWGQLADALQMPREAPPMSETMPKVEASPAGAEELIDWLRAQPDRGWAEKLSIPRVTRFLKEREQYNMTFIERDVRGLAESS